MNDIYEITEPDFTLDELARLTRLRVDLIDGHGPCGGEGLLYGENGSRLCACRLSYDVCKRLIAARVPGRHLTALATVPDGLYEEINRSAATLVLMEAGTGRTALMAGLCRSSLIKGRSCCYVRASELASSDENLSGRLRSSGLVLIDDLDRAPDVTAVMRNIRDDGVRLAAVASGRDDFFERTVRVREAVTVRGTDVLSEEFREGLVGPEH